MTTFRTDNEINDVENNTSLGKEIVSEALQVAIENDLSKYEIAMRLPELMKLQGIEENVTRYYIRQYFDKK